MFLLKIPFYIVITFLIIVILLYCTRLPSASAATARKTSTNLDSISFLSSSTRMVLVPSVCAAIEIPSTLGATRK